MREDSNTALFYDRWTDLFRRGFGPVFQAGILRTGDPPREDPEASVAALAARAGVTDGDRVLDAGCGVGGPAVVMAQKYPTARFDGVTNSGVQADIARERIAIAGLSDRVAVHVADYQRLPFRSGTFDVVVFFESTGYTDDPDRMYREAARVLVPGGRVYVKDVFCRRGRLSRDERGQLDQFDELWGCVRTRTMEESVASMATAGLQVESASVMDDIGTALLAGSMFTLGASGDLTATEMGRRFAPRGLHPPIEFGEISARLPSGDDWQTRRHSSIE